MPVAAGSPHAPDPKRLPFASFFDFVAKIRPNRDELEALVLSGALDSLAPNRRAMLWAIPSALAHAHALAGSLEESRLPLDYPEPGLPEGIADFDEEEKAVHERHLLGLDVQAHLMAFERERVASRGGLTTLDARRLPHGRKAIVVGNPIRLRFPPTPSGKRVVFFDLDDETGLLNVTCFDATYRLDGHAIVCSPYVTVIGHSQDRDGHIAFLASRVFPYHPVLLRSHGAAIPIVSGDFIMGGAKAPSPFRQVSSGA